MASMTPLKKLSGIADQLTALPLAGREREKLIGLLRRSQLEGVALILAARITVMRERGGILSGDEVLALRRRMGWTQTDLAARVGVAPNTVARWERGEMIPSQEMARRIMAEG
jgi:DNA-binding XRE family transcriptional regulator